MSRWYRAYEGTCTDAKLGEVALVAGCSRSVAIAAWHCLLEAAAVKNDGGEFDSTPRRVAVILGEPITTIEAVFAEMAALGMVEGQTIKAWKQRQYESDNSTERSRKARERKRNGDATLQDAHATAMQRCATPPETETDTDTEELEAKAPNSKPRATKRGGLNSVLRDRPNDVSEQVWSDFTAMRRKMRADVSQTVIAGFRREADRVGWSLEKAIAESVVRNWRGFKAEWVADNDRGNTNRNSGAACAGKRSGLATAIDDGIAHIDAELARIRGGTRTEARISGDIPALGAIV